MAQKISHYLLITLILALGFGQLLRFELMGVPLYLHDVLVFLLLLVNLHSLPRLPLPRPLTIFLFGLSLGWANALLHYSLSELFIPSLYTLRLLAYLTVFLIIKQGSYHLKRSYFIVSGFTSLVIGLFQYYFLPDMRVFQYLGWDDHLNRLTLPHFDPTFSAAMLGLFLFMTYQPRLNFLRLVIILGILLTYSRSVWLALALTGLWYGVTHGKAAKVLIYLAIFSLLILMLPRRFGEGNNLLRTFSLTSRWQTDQNYANDYRFELLVGRGLNTLPVVQDTSTYPNHASGPNNSYLYLLLTTGIVGLYGWLRFLFSLYQLSPYRPTLIFFAVASIFNNVMFYPFALLWILLIHANAKVPTAT